VIDKQNHSIKKYQIELKIENENNAFEIQQKFLSTAKKIVTEKLEDLFDEVVGDNRYLRINKLEIDVGSMLETTFEEDIPNRLPALIEEELRKYLSASLKNANSGYDFDNEEAEDYSNAQILENNQYVFSWLIYFLKQGSFPWWAPKTDFDNFEKENIQLFHKNPKGISITLTKILQHGNILDRLVYQFSEEFLVEFISFLTSVKKGFIIETVQGLKIVSMECGTNTRQEGLKKLIYLPILKTLSSSGPMIDSPQDWLELTIYQFCQLHANLSKTDIIRGLFTYFQNGSDSNVRDEMIHVINLIFSEELSPKTDLQPDITNNRNPSAGSREKSNGPIPGICNKPESLLNLDQTTNEYTGKSLILNGLEKKYSQKSEIINEKEDEFEYYVSNAGLVILAPFLPSFFKELKLLEDSDFKDEEARCRAVHILQHAIDNAGRSPENELVLNKILCNMPIKEAMERDIKLTDEEKNNVTDLLNSVVKHWTALKGSSVESLREGFLQRDGKLGIVDNGWKLIVERKTLDILLTKIPWGFSMIKLPWMNSLVSVEW
jgi:hypothetical protein